MVWIKLLVITIFLFFIVFAPLVILKAILYIKFWKNKELKEKYIFYFSYFYFAPDNKNLRFIFLGLQLIWWLVLIIVLGD